MSTPRRLCGALENYFGGHDQEIMHEILGILDQHYAQLQKRPQTIPGNIPATSPWIFSQDAQPPVGVTVITLDVATGFPDDINTANRKEGQDWTDPAAWFWWMHVPPPPEGGLLNGQESPETRMDIGHDGGHQQLPEDGALANKIAAIMQQWVGTNGGVYAIRGCAMEIAREIRGAAAPSAKPATARELLRRAELVLQLVEQDRSTTICAGGLVHDISTYLAAQPVDHPADQDITPKGDIVGWLRLRADQGICAMTPSLAREIAEHIEALQKEAP